MGHYTYLLIDLLSLSVPLLASFHPRLQFHRRWGAFWPACLMTAFVFCLWDALYTHLGVWNFNPRYISGVMVGNLPIEEVLFFICIPYSSVFTYHCLNSLLTSVLPHHIVRAISFSLMAILGLVACIFPDRLYTSVTFALATLLLRELTRRRVPWLGSFFRAFLVVLIPFFIVNGLLTGAGLEEAVVRYNDAENLGIRLWTIPIEDVFYGMLLLLVNVTLYEFNLARHIRPEHEG